MSNFISITDLRQGATKIINTLPDTGDQIVFVNNKPKAVLIDYDEYQEMLDRPVELVEFAYDDLSDADKKLVEQVKTTARIIICKYIVMPLIITTIIETKKIENFLIKRRLIRQYQKAKEYILDGDVTAVQFKIRKPKSDRFFYFRINKQYRARCILEGTTLKVFKIDDHQN